MKVFNKLVRDKIPDIIQTNDEICKYRILDNDEYLKELNIKLKEEVNSEELYLSTNATQTITLDEEGRVIGVWFADVDMDGKYEVIVYAKVDSLFSDVYIYGVGVKISVLEYVYTIAPMP